MISSTGGVIFLSGKAHIVTCELLLWKDLDENEAKLGRNNLGEEWNLSFCRCYDDSLLMNLKYNTV